MEPIHALFLFFVLVALGEQLFIIIAALAMFCFVFLDASNTHGVTEKLSQVILSFSTLSEQDALIAIPLFTLAGNIMTHGGISSRLVSVARALFGFLPGGLAWACVGACTLFAAISGSSAVTIIAIGGLIYPALSKAQYSDRFSLGLITSCGAVGILLPPSLPIIVYGVVASNAVADGRLKPSIDELFRAGLVPSLLSVGVLCLYSSIVAIKNKIPAEKFSFAELVAKVKSGFFALFLVVILLGGIYGGITTATEASAVACIYALIVEMFIHKEISARDLLKIGQETIKLVGVILMILVSALAFTNFLTIAQVPEKATDAMQWDRVTVKYEKFSDAEYDLVDEPVFIVGELKDGGVRVQKFSAQEGAVDYPKDNIGKRTPSEMVVVGRAKDLGPEMLIDVKDPTDWDGVKQVKVPKAAVVSHDEPLVATRLGFLLFVNLLLLVVGSVMDIFSGIVIIAPLIVPIAVAYNVNLVHLGIIFVLNLELGLAHPPLGINLFIAQSYFRRSIMEVTISAIPFLLLLLGVVAAVTYWEPLALMLTKSD